MHEIPHVQINEARLWYAVRGHGELLLHHGYTASRANRMPVAQRLEARCHGDRDTILQR
ncbi:MAG: hypothetical protein QF921_03000 [Pseudomonadales bacterium]|mgnify:FL=1|jgi:hypothetical protein|nr:hypothetical protein [Pseudomonadales bacterium]MDP6471205.1 hypothetical protein [Pseudomonadales bacterium]MDP6825606.1 hypothetical protein [Pseudomonadales bacterium]MDP6970477.1 hypothetical protein [Pseudomonadales bacterium]|tara:strand:+ start:339 stop:515 length:177 start_codon:yes stop_codon:yes gene_type:complete